MIKHILVPLDGTPQSNSALPLTRTLARATGASVTLLRVRLPGEDRQQLAALQRVEAELSSSDIQVNSVVRDGDPVDQIIDQVRADSTDLVVMRTHGRSGIGRAVLGSVTERVVAEGGAPVILLRAGGRRINQLRSILVPLDGSPGSLVALGLAIPLADDALTGAARALLGSVTDSVVRKSDCPVLVVHRAHPTAHTQAGAPT